MNKKEKIDIFGKREKEKFGKRKEQKNCKN
jgi:hypothetical protein